ncbi:MAG: MMPL family transporter [Acidimicrobiales bacterium]
MEVAWTSVFSKLAQVVTNHPWQVIGAWLVGIVVVIALSPTLAAYTSNNDSVGLPGSYQSVRAQSVASRSFPAEAGASGSIAVSRADRQALTAADQATVNRLATQLAAEHIPGVSSVSTSAVYLSGDMQVQIVQVVFTGQVGAPVTNAAVSELRQQTDRILAGTGMVAGLTGNAAISVDSTVEFSRAQTIIEVATVVIIVVLLGLVFRSLILAVTPIVIIGIAHQAAQALSADVADLFHYQVGSVMDPLLIVVMFGVGTDYFVFLLSRYREQVARGDSAPDALRFAITRAGEVITSAAGTVMAAFAALLAASLSELRTLAPGLIVGVTLMLITSLTLVPAVLTLLGGWAFWPSTPRLPAEGGHTRTQIIARDVSRWPALVLAGSVLVLCGLDFGLLGYTTTYNQLAELPASTPSQQAYDTIAAHFPAGVLGPTQIFVVSAHPLNPAALDAFTHTLSGLDGVGLVAPAQYSVGGHDALIQVILKDNPYSPGAIATVTGPLDASAGQSVPGASTLVGGTTSQVVDIRGALAHDLRIVIPLALVIVAIILGLLLRALVAPLYILAGVILTYVATLGSLSLVFLHGAGYEGLDFVLPVVVYIFVMAVGTDYNILIAARMREEFAAGRPPRQAARNTVLHGSPAVFAAALILAGTFASLIATGIQLLEEIGLAVTIGVLLAANLLATRIIPTIAALRGYHFWWPSHMHRLITDSSGGDPANDSPDATTAGAPPRPDGGPTGR